MMLRPPAALLCALMIAACARGGDDAPVDATAIGAFSARPDPNRAPLTPADALLLDATAQGLVAFDGAGQVEPALAERWIVTDDGLGYIFRLRDIRWPDGKPVTTGQVAARLRAALRPSSRNPLKPWLGAIEEIAAVTPQVIDIRLSRPEPALLGLLARPELAIIGPGGAGSGPYRVLARKKGLVTLAEIVPPAGTGEEDEEEPPRASIRLRADAGARAVARFTLGLTDGVLGGTLGSLPLARAANPPRAALRFDQVKGLYGFALEAREGPLADPGLRRALAMAIDRGALLRGVEAATLTPAITLVPPGLPDLADPEPPDWANAPIELRRHIAGGAVAAWRTRHGVLPPLRVAIPEGAGHRIAMAQVTRDWSAIGVAVEMVGEEEPADLRLIDEVAPVESAVWYLARFGCGRSPACVPEADARLAAAAVESDPGRRGQHLAEADQLIAAAPAYIPIAMPMRWSLVGRRLDGFRENALGIHPLARLRNAPPR